jgi:spermidine synthase
MWHQKASENMLRVELVSAQTKEKMQHIQICCKKYYRILISADEMEYLMVEK